MIEWKSLVRYGIVGCFNTLLNFLILNLFMWVSGVTSGVLLIVFSITAFIITLLQSYVWNRWWVFKGRGGSHKKQLSLFSGIAIATALIGNALLYFFTTVTGAPPGIHPQLWVNIVAFVLIPLSFFGNYLGNQFFVFKKNQHEVSS